METKWSPFHRIWHWTNGLVIFLLLCTVALRETFFDPGANTEIIRERLVNAAYQNEDVVSAARAIRENMWQWHYYLGFTLTFLTFCRGIQLLRKKDLDSLSRMKTFRLVLPKLGDFKDGKNPGIAVVYLFFYILLAFMIFSGFVLYFDKELGLIGELRDSMKEAHELGMWSVVIFTFIHIAGVIWAETKDEKGIISDMVNGGEK